MRGAAFLVLLLVTPAAAACSMSAPVAMPGAFTLALADGSEREVVVDGRLLGAGCELSNRHALAGGLFAWVEVERFATGYPWDLHVLDLATGEERVHRDVAGGHVDALGLYERTALLYWRDWSTPAAERTFVALDVDTGERRRLPMPPQDYVSVTIERSVVAALSRDGDASFLTVYDARADRFLRESEPVPSPAWLRAASDRWLVLDGTNGGLRAQRIEGGPFEPFGGSEWLVDVDGDDAYLRGEQGLVRVRLTDGSVGSVPVRNATLLSVHEGAHVYGRYSAPEHHRLGPFWWIEAYPLAVAGGALLLAAAIGLPTWWRWRRARG